MKKITILTFLFIIIGVSLYVLVSPHRTDRVKNYFAPSNIQLQTNLTRLSQDLKNKLHADSVMLAIMDTNSSKIVATAQAGLKKYNFSTYIYEPGNTIRPLLISLALQDNNLSTQSMINTENGIWKFDSYHTLDDTAPAKKLSVEQIILQSSNIGTAKLTLMLSKEQIENGLKHFGLHARYLNSTTARIALCNGYGIKITPLQMLKAYNILTQGNTTSLNVMQNILQKNTKLQFNNSDDIANVIIGGQTGMAHMVKDKKYTNTYNASYFGFVKDKKAHSYVVGIVVINPTLENKKSFRQSIGQILKNIMQKLLQLNYLKS